MRPSSASSYAFDPENHFALQTVGLTQTKYQYDGGGELSRRTTHNIFDSSGAQDVKDVFVDGIYEAESTGCGPATSVTKYYMAFGRVIA